MKLARPTRLLASALVVALSAATLSAGPATAGPSSAPTEPQTSFSFTSAPGDYVGQGEKRSFSEPAYSFSVSGDRSHVVMSLRGDDSQVVFYAALAAGYGDTLHPGTYHGAERDLFQTGRSPGLDVGGENRDCNQVFGSFTVNQVAFDDAGSLTSADISFVQRCNSAKAPKLEGTLHFHYLPLSYTQRSDPGDYVGGGASRTYLNSTSLITLTGDGTSLDMRVSGLRDDWRAGIAAPPHRRLVAGKTYQTTGSGGRHQAALSVTGDGHGCNTATGTVTIKRLTVVDGQVTRAWLTFVQHCEGAKPALTGVLHYYD